ncbi:hypothetical protein FOQG_05613 [Fusarium oxysporum f. sp. raphani 54005]|uniref:Uncharacterized protein n=6 Tax=Fusarium oxysporum TaxID=5507 RepID=W9IVD9_FUSOX|nr:hypothetical protein FOXG_19799 [Fusarium oxysporum f. sp. lycopersici 4287]EWY96471.1 hypothetical protein FOYG_05163 [Fusarium oxysporum NRRL 32931]EXA48039.1 hypothetical protein FOVG_04926 [Fusarium oxysporum f. sp. pisi HDV247]EXK31881.1 hypothetical protein FOMG_12280 [Fusarium oxysporum f. sp. melonis 26406]EXK92484.1 hypothetical protein FOQG_05613 [Fusarium oxysporum f. sp. raphani 54005]EXL87180.1 hypothetical protein FOPG_01495 [Fusarium oxysporum f. sp. conglutinans race 2 54008
MSPIRAKYDICDPNDSTLRVHPLDKSVTNIYGGYLEVK